MLILKLNPIAEVRWTFKIAGRLKMCSKQVYVVDDVSLARMNIYIVSETCFIQHSADSCYS
jgi:hypothetical protein